MAINLKLSSSASGTRNVVSSIVNMGGGSNLVQRSLFSTSTPALAYSSWYNPGAGSPALSTSAYYLMNGIWWSQPYDLDTMGSEGATIKAREGFRYVWMMGADHPLGSNYQGSGDFYVGYSNCPQTWPSPTTMRMLRRQQDSITVTDQNSTSQTGFFAYMAPTLVYNPDTPNAAITTGDKIYIYCESQANGFQHELALFTTSDFLTTTLVGPTIPTTMFVGWTSLGYVERRGVGDWIATTNGTAASGSGNVKYKYTSTDGWVWTRDTTVIAGGGPWLTIAGQKYLVNNETGTTSDYLALQPVDSNYIATGGAFTRISDAFGPSSGNTHYPAQTWAQDKPTVYEEDGVATINVTRGFFRDDTNNNLNPGPYLENFPTYFTVTGGVSGTTLTVSSNTSGYSILPNYILVAGSKRRVISDDGGGSFTLSGSDTIAPGTVITMCRNGGLWNSFIDQYRIITDATAAAGAAPLGVSCDCVAGTVTVAWNDVLPNNTYRVYKGSSAGTQATLVGDVTGVSITDTPTTGQQWWFKVVTMLSGVEQKNRVVHCYVSNNTQMVNRHANRVIDDGGDVTKINFTHLADIDSWLTTNDYYKYLMHWADVRFGVKESGGFITKIYCLGTTRMPIYGDYTPTTSNTWPSTSSNTSYIASGATQFRGTTPSWINNATSAHGFFGNGRANLIQRKNEITLIAAYQKPGTAVASLFGMGQFSSGLYFQHESGSSGNVSATLYSSNNTPAASNIVATAPFSSATNPHVAAMVLDATSLTVYLDGVAGTPVDATAYANPTMANDSVLRGYYAATSSTSPVLVSGSRTGIQTLLTRAYTMDNQAQFTTAALIVFEKGLPSSAITAIGGKYA